MFVQRQFKLINGSFDLQYVSHVNGKGEPTGYDKSIEHALPLTEWYFTRLTAYFDSIGAKYYTHIA